MLEKLSILDRLAYIKALEKLTTQGPAIDRLIALRLLDKERN